VCGDNYMSKDFDDLYKKIEQSHKILHKQDGDLLKDLSTISKDHEKIMKDIIEVKKQINDMAYKIDLMLEILNNFSIMIAEDDEDLEENYGVDSECDETWVPKDEEFWEDDEDDENI